MTLPFSRDIVMASKYPRLIPLVLFIVFVTWYFWISLSCSVGSALSSHICGTSRVRADSLYPWKGRPDGKIDHDNKSENVDGTEPEVVEYQNITGPGIVEIPISILPVYSNDISLSSQNKENEETADAFATEFQKSEASLGKTDSETTTGSDCDLYHGQWYYDPAGPLYTHNSCPVLSPSQNCQSNGRPDKEYEYWRWKPSQCELPRFNASKFLELMSGKTITFAGDSLARNQMESLMCLLWQVEVPRSRGSKRIQRWYFKSRSVTIIRIWSAWLVHQATEPVSYVPKGVTNIHLDIPDENFMELVPRSDIIVISNGHWFTKKSAYFLNNEIVGTQSWSPPPSEHNPMNVTNMEAYGITTETILTAIGTHQNYLGLTFLVSYSPDHYENGAWNTGGSCTGQDKPIMPGQLVENGYTKIMYEKQVAGFNQAAQKTQNQSKLKLMDITQAFGYRHDGHPGPYRNTDPNKITKRGPNGRPPPQDCLHWCMPGPVDIWNELMLETIRREFEGGKNIE